MQKNKTMPGFKAVFWALALAGLTGPVLAGDDIATKTVIWEGQSPVNIDTSKVKRVKNTAVIQYSYQKEDIQLVNTYDATGTVPKEFGTLKGQPVSGLAFNSFVTVNGEKYVLAQFHFHHASEHTINGRSSPMEVHLVHLKFHDNGVPYCIGEPGSLLVIGTLIEEGVENKELAKIFAREDLPVNKAAGATATIKSFNFRGLTPNPNLIPDGASTYRYHGSLTAPSKVDCSSGTNVTNSLNGSLGITKYDSTVSEQLDDILEHGGRGEDGTFPEVVQWVVHTKPITMSHDQIEAFTELFEEGNTRPVQDLNGRTILRMTN